MLDPSLHEDRLVLVDVVWRGMSRDMTLSYAEETVFLAATVP